MNTNPLPPSLRSDTTRPQRLTVKTSFAVALLAACAALAGDLPDAPVAKRVSNTKTIAKQKLNANASAALPMHGYGKPDHTRSSSPQRRCWPIDDGLAARR